MIYIHGKIISRILQIIENYLLESYLDFFSNKNLIPEIRGIALMISHMFDGFQVLTNNSIDPEILVECRKDAYKNWF